MIIGTAGHVDHGKSALVQALTGQAMDRLAEERRRGITIDLGFTSLMLGGERHGVVDVPGHEDFVRTMVAGASGIDVALLVVAANDGIMPQTREHLLVLERLGVPVGIPVITKADLAEPDWVELVRDELAGLLRASPVPFVPPLVVSVRTGEGLDALRDALVAVARAAARTRGGDRDLFRLPVDRAFVVDGVGTVVTGTTWSGTARTGDAVLVWPGGHEARIRSVEVHGAARETSVPGCRTALALSGVSVAEVGRGSVLVHPQAGWRESEALDVELGLAPAAPPLRSGVRLWVHLGTTAVLGRARFDGPLQPGERVTARLRLERPIVARGGDRFVVRSYSPVAVIGGGTVLDPQPVAGRPPANWHREPNRGLRTLVGRRRFGAGVDELRVLAGLDTETGGPDGGGGVLDPDSGLTRCGGRIIGTERFLALTRAALAAVEEHHRKAPTEPGMQIETLRSGLRAPNDLVDEVVERAVRDGRLVLVADLVALPGFAARAAASEGDVRRVREALEHDGLAPRTVAELERDLGFDPFRVLKGLEKAGHAVALGRDHFAWPPALEAFRAVLSALGQDGPITPAMVRERTGLTRKHLIPLLEWADRAGITVREGEARRLRIRAGTPAPRTG